MRSEAGAHFAKTQVLDTAKLFSVEQLTVTIPDRQLGAKALSGHRVSSTRWYSKTRVIFVTSTGAEIKVWDGKATFRDHDTEEESQVCAADVSCSAFLVDDISQQERVIEDANTALADAGLELSHGAESLRRRLSALRLATKEGRRLSHQAGDEDCNPMRGSLQPCATQPAAPCAQACNPVLCASGGRGGLRPRQRSALRPAAAAAAAGCLRGGHLRRGLSAAAARRRATTDAAAAALAALAARLATAALPADGAATGDTHRGHVGRARLASADGVRCGARWRHRCARQRLCFRRDHRGAQGGGVGRRRVGRRHTP